MARSLRNAQLQLARLDQRGATGDADRCRHPVAAGPEVKHALGAGRIEQRLPAGEGEMRTGGGEDSGSSGQVPMTSVPSGRAPGAPALPFCASHDRASMFVAGEPMKPATKVVAGAVADLDRDARLLDPAGVDHRQPVARRPHLLPVVGDTAGGGSQPALQRLDLEAHLHTRPGAEVGERLAGEIDMRVADDGPPMATR